MISILILSYGRPQALKACLTRVFAVTTGSFEVVCTLGRDDLASQEVVKAFPVRWFAEREAAWGMTYAANEVAQHAWGEVWTGLSDDSYCQPHWLDEALKTLQTLPEACGVVGLNDARRRDGQRFATHALTTREYLMRYHGGVLAVPHYANYYVDVELCERAKSLGRYAFSRKAIVEHRRSPDDATRRLALPTYKDDEWTYVQRRAAGFPNDYAPVIQPGQLVSA